jgi:thioredoxin-like negative regulator of GroEL
MAAEDWDGAIELLSRIPDYRDSRSLTLQCHYRKAAALEEAGNLEAAAAEYLMAGSWGDAAERTANITLKQADALFEAGDLRGAHALYASLPDNPECAEKDKACRLSLARDAVNSMEYTLALELLEGVADDYANAGALRTEASYQKAKAAVCRALSVCPAPRARAITLAPPTPNRFDTADRNMKAGMHTVTAVIIASLPARPMKKVSAML